MQPDQGLKAAGLALAASAVLSFIDNFVAAVSQEAGLWQFQVFRTLFALPLLILAARISGQGIRPVNLPRLALRSLAVSVGLLIYFAALGSLPVSQAGAGLFSAPLWVALLSVVLFRQNIGLIGTGAVLLGFVGALMLLQPDLANLTTLSLLPLAAGFFYGLGMMLTRHLCAEESAIAGPGDFHHHRSGSSDHALCGDDLARRCLHFGAMGCSQHAFHLADIASGGRVDLRGDPDRTGLSDRDARRRRRVRIFLPGLCQPLGLSALGQWHECAGLGRDRAHPDLGYADGAKPERQGQECRCKLTGLWSRQAPAQLRSGTIRNLFYSPDKSRGSHGKYHRPASHRSTHVSDRHPWGHDLSGRSGRSPGGSVAEQTQDCLASIEKLLEEAGSDKEHMLQATIWLASMDDFDEMNSVWDKWVPEGHAPTRACGEARLATPDYKVEIILTAARSNGTAA